MLTNREQLQGEFVELWKTLSPFNLLFDSQPLALFIFDEKGFLFSNSSAELLTEFTSEELYLLNISKITDPLFHNQVLEYEMLRLKGEFAPAQYEFQILCKSKKKCWVDYTATQAKFKDHLIVIGLARDISKLKEEQNNFNEIKNEYQATYLSILKPTMLINEHGIVEGINKALLKMFNLTIRVNLIGSHLSRIFPASFSQIRLQAIKKAISEKRSFKVVERYQMNKRTIWLESTFNPLINPDETCSKVLVESRDTTIKKENQYYLQLFSRNMLRSQENERKRVSRELHDGLAQSLAALLVDIRFIENHLSPNQCELYKKSEQVIGSIIEMIDETRRIAIDLAPAILEDFGLSAAIKKLIDDFAQRHGVHTKVELSDLNGLFNPHDEIHIYRIIQEVIANISKHSHAKRFSLLVTDVDNFIEFRMQDDGIGFNYDINLKNKIASNRLGLRDLHERTRLLGGRIKVNSTQGKGTSLTLILPTKARAVN